MNAEAVQTLVEDSIRLRQQRLPPGQQRGFTFVLSEWLRFRRHAPSQEHVSFTRR
jgi:hypothetical protein